MQILGLPYYYPLQHSSDVSSTPLCLPRAIHPPKLQHNLVRRQHNLIKAQPRDDDVMRAPADFEDSDYGPSRGSNRVEAVPELSDEEMEDLNAG